MSPLSMRRDYNLTLNGKAPATRLESPWPEPTCATYCAGVFCRIPVAQRIANIAIKATKAPPVQYVVFLVSGVMVEPST